MHGKPRRIIYRLGEGLGGSPRGLMRTKIGRGVIETAINVWQLPSLNRTLVALRRSWLL
jgi:hypothetical protein